MRLLVVSLNADPSLGFGTLHSGGQTKYVLELGKNLVGLGWGIDVVTVRNRGLEDRAQITEDFLIHRISRPSGKDYDYDLELKEIEDLVRAHPPTLTLDRYTAVLCCYWLSGVYMTLLDPVHRVPRALTLCSLGHFKHSEVKADSVLRRIRVEKDLVKRFDCIVATNRGERSVLEDVYGADPRKIKTIPRGVDVERFGEFTEIPVRR